MNIQPIAYYRSQLPTKFGVPRQSGLVPELVGRVIFEPEFCNADALRGIGGFDYLWLIWGFSACNFRPVKRAELFWAALRNGFAVFTVQKGVNL